MLLDRRQFAQGALLAGAGLAHAGCSAEDFRPTKTPKQGVPLGYKLEVGTSFDGHIRIGSTRTLDGLSELLAQNVECDARVLVMAVDPETSGLVMRTTFRNAEIDWMMPPSAGLSRDDFVKVAGEQLRSLDMRFIVSSRGKVLSAAAPPVRMPPALKDLFDTLALGVGLGFVELPTGPVVKGQAWTDRARTAVAGGKSTVNASFSGLVAQRKATKAYAKLEYDFTTKRPVETDRGTRWAQSEGEAKSLLSPDGFMSRIKADAHEFDPKRGLAVREIRALWSRASVGGSNTTDVQLIDDPCDPDYVGQESCAESP